MNFLKSLLCLTLVVLLTVNISFFLFSKEENMMRKQNLIWARTNPDILMNNRLRNMNYGLEQEEPIEMEMGEEPLAQALPPNPLAANNQPGTRLNGLVVWALGGAELCMANCKMQNDECQIQRTGGCFSQPNNYLLNSCKNWAFQICKARNLVCDKECRGFERLINPRAAAKRAMNAAKNSLPTKSPAGKSKGSLNKLPFNFKSNQRSFRVPFNPWRDFE
jgi:hypothetical protein